MFHDFSLKVATGVQGPAPALKKTLKWIPRVLKWSPGVSKFSPKATKSDENLQHVPQGSHNGAPGATMETKVPTNANKNIKKSHKLQQRHQKVPQGQKKQQKLPYGHRQPSKKTNQPKKQIETQRNKQSNKHTHKSFELQTQTQTPAAGCSPKAT